ncbi:MAG: diguanylate cyclase [Rhodospirillales bacterium]|nr:diguanylate cyclase [Rhodospirillales bacterium]
MADALPSPAGHMEHSDSTELLNLLTVALNRTRDGYVRVDAQGHILAVNPAMTDMFAYSPKSLIGRAITSLFVDHEQAVDERSLTERVFRPPYDRAHYYSLTAMRNDDVRFPVEIRFAEAVPKTGGSQWLIHNISDRLELERLRLSDERYKNSQAFANIGTWDWSIGTDELHWSDTVAPMFGLPPGTKPSYALFYNAVHPDDRAHVRENEIACETRNQKHDVEYRVTWPNGSVHWLHETGNLLSDESGKALRMIGVVRDVTERKEAEQRYRHLAFHDPLTGLPNRGLFEQRLQLAIKRAIRHGTATGLIFIDLGKFKAINDTYGHLIGDKVLVVLGERLKAAVRSTDMVARIGGDEFIVILEGIKDVKEIRTLAQKLIERLTLPMTIDNHVHNVTVNLGASICPGIAHDAESLIHSADMAMYKAKAQSGSVFEMADCG